MIRGTYATQGNEIGTQESGRPCEGEPSSNLGTANTRKFSRKGYHGSQRVLQVR
jgi:hypothetical protein